MKKVDQLFSSNVLFKDMAKKDLAYLKRHVYAKDYAENEWFFREADQADWFYILIKGKVAIESPSPDGTLHLVQVLHPGDVLGWSWLIPPHNWRFDVRALTKVETAAFDAKMVRAHCEKDKDFGYEIYKRFSFVLAMRLEMSRLQWLDKVVKSMKSAG